MESCRMSLTLAEIDRNAPIESDLTRYIPKPRDTAGCSRLMTELELFSLMKRMEIPGVAELEAAGEPVPEEIKPAAALRLCRLRLRRQPACWAGRPPTCWAGMKMMPSPPWRSATAMSCCSAQQGNWPLKGSVLPSTGQRGSLHGIPSCSTATAWQGSTRCPR